MDRRLLALPLAAALLVPATASAATGATARAAAVTACPAAASSPSPENITVLESTVLCLVNRERTRRGLPRLRSNDRLASAATRHSRDMVRRNFFDHTAPGGSTMSTRIKASGYLSGARSFTFGENLAWGTGRLGTPVEIVDRWMRSPGHRANILQRGFREIGVGVQFGAPGHDDGATYTTDFGAKAQRSG